jgi:hypothetical protein
MFIFTGHCPTNVRYTRREMCKMITENAVTITYSTFLTTHIKMLNFISVYLSVFIFLLVTVTSGAGNKLIFSQSANNPLLCNKY